MSDKDDLDIFHPDIVRAFAASWASIDGKLEAFEREEIGPMPRETPGYTGHYEGYMVEADELLRRAGKRLGGRFDLWEVLGNAVENGSTPPTKGTQT